QCANRRELIAVHRIRSFLEIPISSRVARNIRDSSRHRHALCCASSEERKSALRKMAGQRGQSRGEAQATGRKTRRVARYRPIFSSHRIGGSLLRNRDAAELENREDAYREREIPQC